MADSRTRAAKFLDPEITADGAPRARVDLIRLETLWFNTGSLCNIECRNCYVFSSPSNDRLVYLTAGEVCGYLDEIADRDPPVGEIGFTGGEPFLNPDFLDMLEETLARGFPALVLTNAMRPMMRPPVRRRLSRLGELYADRFEIRVSLDHYSAAPHEAERGPGSWKQTLEGIRWLSGLGPRLSVAGRTRWGEREAETRAGYADLFEREGLGIPTDPARLVLFPELDASADVPEITTECWSILGVSPADMMCARSRMIVKRRGAAAPTVVPCTLLPDDTRFDSAEKLSDSLGTVYLDHPHCSKFCVLGGGSCSVR